MNRPDTPNPDEVDEWDSETVYALLANIGRRDIKGFGTPDGQTFRFDFEETTYYEEYRFEVNFHGGSMWLHHYTEDGFETVWKNKRRR